MADQIVTVADVKTRLGITDATDDALIQSYIEGVTDWLQQYTHRKLVAQTGVTVYVDTQSGSTIRFPRGIRTVTSLSVASSDQPDDGSGTYTAVSAADVILRPSSGDRREGWPATRILIRGQYARLAEALNGAKIVGDIGFSPSPPALQLIAYDAVAAAMARRSGGPSMGETGQAFPWATLFEPDALRTIELYSEKVVG